MDDAVGPDTKLRQGDLIAFEEQANLLHRAGIIVTADCDLEQRKHARLVILVPIVSADTILEQYLLIEDCERKRELIVLYALKELGIDKEQDRDTSLSALRQAYLTGLNGFSETVLIASGFVLDLIENISISSYKVLMEAIKSGPKNAISLCGQIRSRGDLLILPDTQGLGISGEIAWLRHIWQVPLGDIAIRTSEISSRPGERIARLDSPYRYRLTQLMAQVFSDIGLPSVPDKVQQVVEDLFHNA